MAEIKYIFIKIGGRINVITINVITRLRDDLTGNGKEFGKTHSEKIRKFENLCILPYVLNT